VGALVGPPVGGGVDMGSRNFVNTVGSTGFVGALVGGELGSAVVGLEVIGDLLGSPVVGSDVSGEGVGEGVG